MMFAFLGLTLIAVIFAIGVFQVFRHVTWRSTPDRYTYRTDKEGNESVKDHSDAE